MVFDIGAVLSVASAVIPAASAVSSAVNHTIRQKTAAEAEIPKWFLGLASVLNLLSVNLDKAMQIIRMFKAK